MIQAYADGSLVYDSRLDEYRLLALSYTAGVNLSGTATLQLPPNHPAARSFVAYKTVVTIYRDGELLFRGRAITAAEDKYKRLTITCEGERGFFLDSIQEPYLYQTTPAEIFASVVNAHNEQMDAFKRFQVGTVTVVDANNYVRMETTTAEQTSVTLGKLVDRCGGFITFTDVDGVRAVNWLADLGFENNQAIEFGANLTDYAKSDNTAQPISVVYPYGAEDENGVRLTVESVNNGIKYVEDAEAVAVRGRIVSFEYWDDVTNPLNLLRKAQEKLDAERNVITRLQLTAVDLAQIDKSLDHFHVGDAVRVVSKPHGVNDLFIVQELREDLVTASVGSITLGKDRKTLTGLGAEGDKKNTSDLQRVEQQLRAEYQANTTKAIAETQAMLTSLIQQTSEAIRLEVSKTYTTNEQLDQTVSTTMEQLSDSITFSFNTLKAVVDKNDAEAKAHISELASYIRMVDGRIVLGKGAEGYMTLTLENDRIVFQKKGQTFGWWDGVDFHTGNIVVEVNERAQFGNFAFVPRTNGSLSFLKIGG